MIITIKVVPKSSKDHLSWYDQEKKIFKLNLRSPAVEGKANKNLIDYLSKFFKLKKNQILIKSGESSKLKLVELDINEQLLTEYIKNLE